MIKKFEPPLTRFPLNLVSVLGDHFVMMAGMGFFQETYKVYRMILPPGLTSAKVKRAALNYVDTEDEDYVLHPENLVSCRPISETHTLARRLWAIDRFNDETKCLGHA
jgi:hypothetical protein